MTNHTTSEHEAREALARNPFPDLPWIRIEDDGIAIVTGYSEALHRLLRWVPKAQWRVSERRWLVPFSAAEAIRAVLPEITRLAEAARDLDGPVAARPASVPGTADLLEAFVEGAALLYGPSWRAALARDGEQIADWLDGRTAPNPGDPLVSSLASGLRQKASAFVQAAERLEAGEGSGRGADRTSSP